MRASFYCFFFLFISLAATAQEQKQAKVFAGNGMMNGGPKILDLSYQNLFKLPANAFDQNIYLLILDNNNLTELPNNIANLSNLRALSVRNNNLQDLNQLIIMCKKLEELYLSGNPNLSELPSLSELKNLKIIDVTDTGIHNVPASIWMLGNLYYFKYTEIKK
jgi:Leucine-rich repeat (LRR) protein